MDKVSAGKIGKYEIVKVLGRGGMGEVILAQDEVLGRRVAIKRPFKSALEEGLARFQLEARAATLRHPNIPAVYEMGEEDGLPFIVMEFVEGEPLDKIINSGRHIDLITKLSIIEQVCSALGYAHEKGIIHRDIKPANVIVQPDGVAKIIDFGIAKIQDPGGNAALTQTSQILGSLYYIAPERFKGEASDGRVDIFSAGVMLFKLLTGKEPFTGGEATASYKIVNEAHSPLGAYLQDYPPALDGILEKSLAKNPDDRYLAAEDFADALHEVIEDLKKSRVFQLFDDAERLAAESRYTPALELLDEAIKLDPANTQARKLRKMVREHQERIRRAERLREYTTRADEALVSGNYDEALNQLKEAERLDATSTDIKARIQTVEDKKRRRDMSSRALADADAARKRSDLAGAQRIVAKALAEDPDNQGLMAASGALAREAEIEAQRSKVVEIVGNARRALEAKDFAAVEQLLSDANSMDPSNLEIDKLRRETARAKEQEERREILEEIQRRVNEFLKSGSYDQASDLLNRAIDKLPNEATLHRLKALVDSERGKFESKRIVDSAIAKARDLFERSPLEAIALLQQSTGQVEGEERERLISFERSLRHQWDMLRVEQVRAEVLSKARDLMAGKQFDGAIGALESFQVEFGQHGDIDDLLSFAREELARQNRSAIIDRCATEGRTLIRDGHLDEAIRLLEHGIQETGDASLSRLLEEIREQRVVAARKIELVQKRVALSRERGEFDEAIRLLQEYLAEAPKSALVLELLDSVQADREQKQAALKAIRAAREAAERKDFSAGLESLQAVARAYGESAELTQETQAIEAKRSSHAQEVVGQSVESARAALLKNDPQGALTALKSATAFMDFADAKRRADWERIGQSVKKALQQSGSTSSTAVFDAQLSDIASAKPRKLPIPVIVSASVALVAVAAIGFWMLRPKGPTSANITITKAPPGATVSIDNGPPQHTNASGELTLKTQPGSHEIVVTADGYQPLTDKFDVASGETVQDNVRLTKLPPAGTSGKLSPQGNLPEFKVTVDGRNMGLLLAGRQLILDQGSHTIRYSAPGYADSADHTIQIVANQNAMDSFVLQKQAAPPPTPQLALNNGKKLGKLSIQTTPSAQISIDGQFKGPADSSGRYTVDGLTPGSHSVDISLDGYQAIQGRQVSIAAGQAEALPALLTPRPAQPTGTLTASSNSIEHGQSVTLSWRVNNASSVAINEIGPVAPQGSRTVSPSKTTTYQLTANGSGLLSEQTVDVRESRQQAPAPIPPPVVTQSKPAGPDRSALEAALTPYKALFAQASGKSGKECQRMFDGSYKGKLHGLTAWCGAARSFEVSEQCGQSVGGTPEEPTLSCAETTVIHPKDGDPQSAHARKTFQFQMGPDGNWKLQGWE